jgi:hypothetical protein
MLQARPRAGSWEVPEDVILKDEEEERERRIGDWQTARCLYIHGDLAQGRALSLDDPCLRHGSMT